MAQHEIPTALTAKIELGVMFATVHASILFDGAFVGAHVDLDGNVLGDTGLQEYVGEEHFGAVMALRRAAFAAVVRAHREIGMEVDNKTAVRQALAVALPHLGQAAMV